MMYDATTSFSVTLYFDATRISITEGTSNYKLLFSINYNNRSLQVR